jgi:hypothetical protein
MSARDDRWILGQDPLPAVRVVKDGEIALPRRRWQELVRARMTPSDATRDAIATVIGLWPLILILGVTVALLWSAGYQQP